MVPLNMFKPSVIFSLTDPRRCFLCGSFLLFLFLVSFIIYYIYYTVLFVPHSLVITFCERPLDSLVCDVSLCFLTSPYGVLGKVCYLIVSIPDPCLLLYFLRFSIHVQYIMPEYLTVLSHIIQCHSPFYALPGRPTRTVLCN